MRILTVNAGSTSTKVHLVEGDSATTLDGLESALSGPLADAVAHRVVHGGDLAGPAIVDDDLMNALAALADRAPLHQPPALDAIDRCRRRWRDVVQVVCPDTSFHRTLPPEARTYALPPPWRDSVRAVGFHGLSYAWAAHRLSTLAPHARRAVVAHLGGGQSLCALRDGRSVATTMGFSPIDGLVMATRSGSLDPGGLAWLSTRAGDLTELLAQRSGLLGLCGDSDLRRVRERAAAGDADAVGALAVWQHRAIGHLGTCIAHLGGLDALVFTGGIGEHDHASRLALAGALGWVGVAVDDGPSTPTGVEVELTAPGARVRTFVIPSREELQMAHEARTALRAA